MHDQLEVLAGLRILEGTGLAVDRRFVASVRRGAVRFASISLELTRVEPGSATHARLIVLQDQVRADLEEDLGKARIRAAKRKLQSPHSLERHRRFEEARRHPQPSHVSLGRIRNKRLTPPPWTRCARARRPRCSSRRAASRGKTRAGPTDDPDPEHEGRRRPISPEEAGQ